MINPVAKARTSYGMTQKQLADYLEITPQVITNLESGLFNTIPSNIKLVLHLSDQEYRDWVIQQRSINSKYFIHAETRWGFPAFKISISQSNRGFCRKLVFQPSILREYEQHKRSKQLVRQALSEVGLTHEQLTELRL